MDDIVELIQGLYLVYNPRSPLGAGSLILLIRQYEKALAGCDSAVVRRACEIWQYERESKRFPYPNEFMAIVKTLNRPKAEDKAEVAPWMPLDRAQYDALTMAEKSRHCAILGATYRRQAGGMFAKGKGEGWINPDNAARFNPLAEKCEAEAKRLDEIVREARARSGGESDQRRVRGIRHISEALPF